MLYKGSFASLNNHLYEVRIVTNNDESQQMEITMAGDPVILSTKSDGLFSPVKSRGCTISIISSSYHFDMYNPSNQGVSVTIYDHYYSYIVFRGYVTPCVYSQEYLNDVDEIQLECIDALSTLKNIPYTKEDQQYKIRSFRYLIDKCLSAAGYNDYEFPANLTVPNMSGNPLDILGVDEENFFDDDKDRSPWSLYEVLEEISKFFCVVCTPYHNKIQFVSYPCVARDFNTYRNASDSTITLKKDYSVTKDEYRSAGAQIDLTEVYNKLSLSCNEYPIRETEKDVFDKENRAGYNETKLISRLVYDDKETEEWNLAWETDISNSLSGLTGLDYRQRGTNFYTMWYKQHGNCYDTHWYRPQSGFTTSPTIRAVEIDVGPKPYFMFPFDTDAATTTSPFTQMGFSLTWGGNGPLLTSNQYQMIGALPFRQSIVSFDTAKDEFGDTPSYSNALMFSLGKATTQNESMYDINLPLYTWRTGKKIYTPQEGYRTYIVIDGSINFVHNRLWSQYRHFPYPFNDLEKKGIKDFGDDYLAHIPLFYYDLTVGNAKWTDENRLIFPNGTTVDHEYDTGSSWKTFNAIYPKLMYSKTTQKYELNSDINFDCTSDYRLGLSGKGYAIPITPEDVDVNGEIVLTIYKPFIASSAIVRRVAGVSGSYSRETFGYDEDEYPHFAVIKDLKIDVITVDENFDPFKVDDEQDDDLLYELMIDPTNIVEHDTTELKINTQRPDRQPTLSAVMLNETKYLETLNDAVDSEMTNSLQEWHILQHMYDHYRKPRVMLGLTVEDELPPYTKVLYPTQFPERIFVVDSQKFDLRNAQNTLQLIEYEDDENYVPSTGNTSGNTSGSTTGSTTGETSWLDGLKVRYIYEDGTDEIVDYASEGIERDTVLTSADTKDHLYKLREVIVGDGWTAIDEAFRRCTSLASVTIGNGVTRIYSYEFSGCTRLTNVTIGSGVTSIGYAPFSGCTRLNSITCYATTAPSLVSFNSFGKVADIGTLYYPSGSDYSTWFRESLSGWWGVEIGTENASGLKVHYYYAGGTDEVVDYASEGIERDTVLTSADTKDHLYKLREVIVGDAFTSIGAYTFSGCTSLARVRIPDSVTSIATEAFRRCTSLTGITIPDSVTSIGDSVFRDCWSLSAMTIPDSVTEFGVHVFYDNAYHLKNVTIGHGVKNIGVYTFYNCKYLENVTIGSGVTSIEDWAFSGCTSLNSITCYATTAPIIKSGFYDAATIGTLYYPSGSDYSTWFHALHSGWGGVEI